MIRVAVCDDEAFMRDELSGLVSRYLEERCLSSYEFTAFENGNSLLESQESFDLIFLDIQMESPDGMETARRLREREQSSLLVFVTVLKEPVFEAFKVRAFDYLVKPLKKEIFERTMDRALREWEQKPGRSLFIQKRNSCQVILLSKIVYCEVLGRKIYIHEKDKTVTEYYERLEELERRVDRRFYRCHRSYLVNLDYVRGCKGGQILLPGGEQIPVSRLRERELTQVLLRRMKERTNEGIF